MCDGDRTQLVQILSRRVQQSINAIVYNYSPSPRRIQDNEQPTRRIAQSWPKSSRNQVINKLELSNCFIENNHQILLKLADLVIFSFLADVYSYHICGAWYNCSYPKYAKAAKPIKTVTLELHNPMMQFAMQYQLIKLICCRQQLSLSTHLAVAPLAIKCHSIRDPGFQRSFNATQGGPPREDTAIVLEPRFFCPDFRRQTGAKVKRSWVKNEWVVLMVSCLLLNVIVFTFLFYIIGSYWFYLGDPFLKLIFQ